MGILSLTLAYLPAASKAAENFDTFWNFLLVISIAVFVVVVGAAFIFAIKYKRKREGEPTLYLPHDFRIEFWALFLTSVVVAITFAWGWFDYKKIVEGRVNEYEINVIGQQWSWQIQYANGQTFTNEIFVPRGKPVKLIMTAKDVLHSFYIPAFRIKQDAVPGQYTTLRFEATKTGVFDVFCAEYCGTSHSGMIGKIYVMEPEDFAKWQAGLLAKPAAPKGDLESTTAKVSLADQGASLYRSKSCATCHSLDGSRLIGPSFKGIFGRKTELADGSTVEADENYIRESVMDPMKKVVKGYPPAMPSFRGQFTDEELNQLISYLKTVK